MTVGSLFAGIGGFDLGFERAGFEIRWQVEIDPWARRVLAKHWPHVHRHDDIRTAGAHNLEAVDVLCGGFPCQDISLAGKGAGIDGARSGLWAEYARLIRELRPRYVVVENVSALLARGLGRVLGDLAACGLDAEWDCIPAAAVGAPHRRDRLWIVAYPCGAKRWRRTERRKGRDGQLGMDGTVWDVAHAEESRGQQQASEADAGADGGSRRDGPQRGRSHVADAASRGQPERGRTSWQTGHAHIGRAPLAYAPLMFGNGGDLHGWSNRQGRRAVPESRERGSADGPAAWWRTEPNVGRVAHGIPKRVDRLRGLGNAVVPQIPEWIAQRILAVEQERAA